MVEKRKGGYSELGEIQCFTAEIWGLLKTVQGNLNSIDNKVNEINNALLPPQVLKNVGEICLKKEETSQGWFKETITKLQNLRDKSGHIQDELELLLNEVSMNELILDGIDEVSVKK